MTRAGLSFLIISLCAVPARAENVLLHVLPQAHPGGQLTDGQVMSDGAHWLSPGVVTLSAADSITWDLGSERPLDGAALQADNNDDYLLEVSTDGTNFMPWWRALPVNAPGLQTRSARLPAQPTRFVRLRASGGDNNFSVSEVEVFVGGFGGSNLLRPWWEPRHPSDIAWLWLVLGIFAYLLVLSAHTPRPTVVVLSALAVAGFGWVVRSTLIESVVDAPRLNFLRGAVALLGATAVVRSLLFQKTRPEHRAAGTAVLGVSAVMGVLCFLNLGRPQFFDQGKGAPTYLHHYDMRTYYPIAKYFPELRFDGVYAASALAVAEEHGGLDAYASQRFRDLRTHEDTTIGQARSHIEQVRARFSSERWASFVEDMRYFRRAMGDGGFLGSMNDHGGNATPVWFLTARALFFSAPASDGTLWSGVMLDVVLALLAFAGLWHAFGARTAFVGMAVFGAMDFYQFGSNWFGAALRHDWLSLWCLSLWALRQRHFRTAGVLLAWSALIRAFPALGFVTLTLPIVWDLAAALRSRTFTLKTFVEKHRDFMHVAIGAALATAILLAVSVALFGTAAWPEWLHKVSLLDRDGHVNNIAVRTWVTTTREQWLGVLALTSVLVLLVTRGAKPETAVAWAVVLLPVVFNPANYYLHSAFMLTVLAQERRGEEVDVRGRLSWLLLLLMCTASAYTNLPTDIGLHFRYDTYVLLTTLAALLAVQLSRWVPRLSVRT